MKSLEKVLVTGGLGLIGSHLVQRLLKQGSQVLVVDNQSTGTTRNLDNVVNKENLSIQVVDVLDSEYMVKLLSNVDFCFHLAASLGVKRILASPIESYETNVHGTQSILEAASKNSVPIFLASTSEIYGDNPEQPLREDSKRVLGSPLKIRWSYAEAKALDESLAQMYAIEKELKFIVGRFFNTVGPRQIGDYGMVLPRFVKAALQGDDLEVYGNGDQKRVFCHVDDAVEAILQLVRDEASFGEAFNIGGEDEISISELAQTVTRVLGSQSKIKYVPYEQAYIDGFEETFRRVPDTSKLRALTGWKPIKKLEETIRDIAQAMKI